jgi:very-short-patch-repair endonuclease
VELQFIVEIDGKQHGTSAGLTHDVRRDGFLEGLGYQVLRVAGYEVLREDSRAFERICDAVRGRMEEIASRKNPSPPAPLPATGRGEKVEPQR